MGEARLQMSFLPPHLGPFLYVHTQVTWSFGVLYVHGETLLDPVPLGSHPLTAGQGCQGSGEDSIAYVTSVYVTF